MRHLARIFALTLALIGLGALTSCSITPHASVGLDVNYYGGKFHVDPNVHVGITGRP